jgi:putative copper resistance protein D
MLLGIMHPASGGVLLLTHSHAAFEGRNDFLVQVTHTTMGALAVILACARLFRSRPARPQRTVDTLPHG